MTTEPAILVLAEYYSRAVQYLYSIGSRPMDPRYTWVDPRNWKERLSTEDYRGGIVVLASDCGDEQTAEQMAEAVQYAQGKAKKVTLL